MIFNKDAVIEGWKSADTILLAILPEQYRSGDHAPESFNDDAPAPDDFDVDLTKRDLYALVKLAKQAGMLLKYPDDGNIYDFENTVDQMVTLINRKAPDDEDHRENEIYRIPRRVVYGHLLPIIKATSVDDAHSAHWYDERLLDHCNDETIVR